MLPHNKTEGVGTSVLLDNIEIDTLESVGPHSRNVVHRDVKGDNYLMDRKDNLMFEWWGEILEPILESVGKLKHV